VDKWEYKTLKIATKGRPDFIDEQGLTAMINRLGSDGWEVISTVPIEGSGYFEFLCVFLKRKLK